MIKKSQDVEIKQLRRSLKDALGIIQWMSGSYSFSPEGEAYKGWIKAKKRYDKMLQLV